MKNIQIILNAILSKDIFEYVLFDSSFQVLSVSEGLEKYLDKTPEKGDDVLGFLPELVGSEQEIKEILSKPNLNYILESVYKNDYYVNISIEHYDEKTLLVLLHDITDVTLSQQKLLQYSNESILLNNTLQKILDSQNALLFVTHNNEISYTNEQFMQYFSLKRMTDIRRKNLKIYEYLDSSLKSYDALFDKVNSKEEYVVINKDTFILQATWIESTHKLFTLTKVTKLSNEIQIDTLTGVYKKSYFNTQLEKIIDNKEECIVAVLDLDDFKNVNDTYGHQVGDDVLKEFAQLIQNNIRSDDMFARWGGEEFLLLLEHTNVENALKKLESLRKLIDKHTFTEIGHLTSSFGVAEKKETDDMHSLLQRADKALYEAKDNGKNCIIFKKD
jgi:diguanylate cyclase (GGDEF)-like protein